MFGLGCAWLMVFWILGWWALKLYRSKILIWVDCASHDSSCGHDGHELLACNMSFSISFPWWNNLAPTVKTPPIMSYSVSISPKELVQFDVSTLKHLTKWHYVDVSWQACSCWKWSSYNAPLARTYLCAASPAHPKKQKAITTECYMIRWSIKQWIWMDA